MTFTHSIQRTLKPFVALGVFCWLSLLTPLAFSGGSGFDWDKWAAALNDDPCNWIPTENIAKWYGPNMEKESSTTRKASTCKWRNAEGKPVLSLTINTWPSAKEVNHERDGQISQIKNQNPTPFSEISSTHKVTTNILRKDRLIVYIFANDDKETAFVTINGHRTLNEKPELKKQRKERLDAVTRFFLEKYKL